MLRSIKDFFRAEKHVYSHRHRSIEIIAEEKGLDIDSIRQQVSAMLLDQGKVEAVSHLTRRFHIPVSVAWRFVDKLDN